MNTASLPSQPSSFPKVINVDPVLHNTPLNNLDDRRINQVKPLLPPQILIQEEVPLTQAALKTVAESRITIEQLVTRSNPEDDRLLVIVGPCSIHDVQAAKEYASRLKNIATRLSGELFIVMRCYFEKPRTQVGWKGLINDPYLDGSFRINQGLRVARQLLMDLNDMGMPAACEFLDTISPQYFSDLVSWGAIGARTTESQVHRELASGLSMPIGFKNGTDGNVRIAIDAIKAAASPHHFLGVTKHGLSAIVETTGNHACHVILRGATHGPNYEAEHVQKTAAALNQSHLVPRVMVDCSHGNSQKRHENQLTVADCLAEQIASGSYQIMGVMLESHLNAGRQDLPVCGDGEKVLEKLCYGVSITDACIHWSDTVLVLENLAAAVQRRREKVL